MLKRTTEALDALVVWELANSKDLRRYARIRQVLQLALEIEQTYAVRVADVDVDRILTSDAHVRVCNVDDVDGLNDGLGFDEIARRSAEIADRAIGTAGDAIGTAADALRIARDAVDVDGAPAGQPRMAPARPGGDLMVNAVLGDRHQGLRGIYNGHRFGAPYDAPPQIPGIGGGLDGMMTAVVQGFHAALRPLTDPQAQAAQRLTRLVDAREAAAGLGCNLSGLDRAIARTLLEIEAEEVPEARDGPVHFDADENPGPPGDPP
jgi:hypothetical protein